MENPLFTGCLLTSYNVCLVEKIMFQEQLINYKLKVIDMNWKFLLNQWVRILHCNIYVVNRDYEIEKVYGDLIAESSPLYMDPEFFMMLVDRKVKEYPDIYCEYNSVLYASMPFESKKLVMGPVSIIKPTRELEKFMTDTLWAEDWEWYQSAVGRSCFINWRICGDCCVAAGKRIYCNPFMLHLHSDYPYRYSDYCTYILPSGQGI